MSARYKLLVERAVWDSYDALREALTTVRVHVRAGARPGRRRVFRARPRWHVQSTAVWTVVRVGSLADAGLLLVVRAWQDGISFIECDADAPQCVDCGCVQEMACADGCDWVYRAGGEGPLRCTACAKAVA